MSAPSRPAYNPRFATRPVPLWRQAEVLAFTARQWSTFFDRLTRWRDEDEAYKWFDLDAALADAASTAQAIAFLAGHVGEEVFREAVRAAVHEAKEGRPLTGIVFLKEARR